ncbi:sensor histidine kinase [Sulfurospirillum arcachonense]|uniref:sensor histidine kinase n=1 Tax=Sulfurospirillum arcachonense TaxID=57666 RepID=UPI000467F72C|nr:sensor histidine kinase [Sulfurospirillum arcachonense]
MRFVLLFIIVTFELFATTTPKNILLVHSYHKGYKWSDDISKVFENRFELRGDAHITTIYMDTKRVNTPTYIDRLFKLYKEQFKQRNFDLIVTVDNNALAFVMKYHEQLFKNVPIVFLGINNLDGFKIKENNKRSYITGVVEEVDIEKNIDLILKIHPTLKKLVIINDHSRTGYAIKKDIYRVLPKYKDKLEFEYIDDIEISNLKRKVKNLSNHTAILWVLLFKDKTGQNFTHIESLKVVRKVARVPLYGLWDFYLGEGIVGGVLTSATAQAYFASKMVSKILKGANPEKIPILKKSPNKYMFDYNELQAYNIHIPKNMQIYEVINKPFSFYEEYKHLVWLIFSIIAVITAILILLATNVARRKKSELALTNQLKFIGVLMDTIPNPINYKNLNGQYLGCNKAFAELLGKKKEEIFGRSVFDFFSREWAVEQRDKDKELLKNEGTNQFEKTLHLADGTSRVVTFNKTVYSNIDGNIGGIVSVMDDVTERIQQKQFMIQQSKLAEMGEMVGAIAHQWNEPLVELSAILQDMEFSYAQNEMSEVKMKEFVNESMVQIQYMSQTLKDFRNFLKPSTKKVFFCAKKALDDVQEIIGRQVFYAHINLNITCKDDYVQVYGYENEFKQVLLNIINNAKNKIVSKGYGKNINITIESKEKNTHIKISDDGRAISKKIINFLFDPYFTTNKDGTGLGLYMAKVIVEDKMNGKIDVYNYFDKATFEIVVPSTNNGDYSENITIRR